MPPIRLTVRSGAHAYRVYIAGGLIQRLPALLDEAGLGPTRFIVSSPLVWKLHGAVLERALPGARTILIPDGERSKHVQTVGRVYDALIGFEADRAAAIVAVGGGVIGDTAGFAAATYLRGVALVHVPTTLLAQVDSAIGGKVGVNHPAGKNLIGAFHPPRLVAIDTELLRTLPRREFRAGLYEVVKYGVIASRALFDRVAGGLPDLFARREAMLEETIADSCRIKAEIVSADERESGRRRLLNFGHTLGHAIEAVTRYRRFRHGEAIAYGMLAAAAISTARGRLSTGERGELVRLIQQMGPLPAVGDLSIPELLDAVRRDKKVIDHRLHFVLPLGIGEAGTVPDVSVEELEAALNEIGVTRRERSG